MRGTETNNVQIEADSVRLDGALGLPAGGTGCVLFAHGSGSSRLSPRNEYVARCLQGAGMATLLFDLLTEREAADRANVFDVEFLARRLSRATAWVRQHEATRDMRIAYFGASTGAAAALIAAASDHAIQAIVSRGGRPDLAARALSNVRAPTLLIVGGNDASVIQLNEVAYAQLRCEKRMYIVPGASHLFEEPGTLEEVTRLATEWYQRHLGETEGQPRRA